MMLIMTLLVRDEADILALNLEHHLAQGVDFFIVTDNGSVDATPDILQTYIDRGLLELIQEPSETYAQSRWVTRMAQRAAARGADWVIHADADEFWIAAQPGVRLRKVIRRTPQDQSVLAVQRWNAALSRRVDHHDQLDPTTIRWFDSDSRNSAGKPLPPKVLHRGCATVQIGQGNHSLTWPDPAVQTHQSSDLLILHLPLRGFRHYERKIRQGGRSYAANADLPARIGATWRNDHLIYLSGDLRRHWREQLLSRTQLLRGRLSGRFRQPPNPITAAQPTRGVICLADDNYFFGVRLLYQSLAGQVPLTVYDLGLGADARHWVDSHDGISIRPIPASPLVQAVREACGERSLAKATKREWPLWICPELLLDAPYQQVAWIDADAVVLRGLPKLFQRINRAPFITPENLAPDQTANPDQLLEALPLASGRVSAPTILLNAGVSGWDQQRDRHLLEAYNHPVRCIFQGRSLNRDLVRWHDQGCLIWALQNAGYDASILQNRRWNLCVRHSGLAGLKIDNASSDAEIQAWLDRARAVEPNANIVHWNGHTVPWL
jgi:hypothetical protein